MNSRKRFYLLIGFIVLSLLVAIFSGIFGFNLNSIKNFVTFNAVFAGLLYTVVYAILAVFSFSVSVLSSLGTLLFPWYWVVIYSMVAFMISATIHFYISRKLGRDYVQNYLEKHNKKLEKFDDIVEKNTFRTIFCLSAIYFVPPTLVNLLGGVIKINFKKYFLSTFIGNLPNVLFAVLLINGILYSDSFQIYFSIIGLILFTIFGLYLYKGEIKNILQISFPWFFKSKRNN